MLDNIDHLCAMWNYEGLERAQKLLDAGASNIGNVIFGEQVAKLAGAPVSHIDEKSLEATIRAAHRNPKKQRRQGE
jgi:2-iminoacetate synthase ThiH